MLTFIQFCFCPIVYKRAVAVSDIVIIWKENRRYTLNKGVKGYTLTAAMIFFIFWKAAIIARYAVYTVTAFSTLRAAAAKGAGDSQIITAINNALYLLRVHTVSG